MVIISVKLLHLHNVEEVKRILGPSWYSEDGHMCAIVRDSDMAEAYCTRLNALHGVQARILEKLDANSKHS